MATALFVCLHNAGRAKLSAALFERGGYVVAYQMLTRSVSARPGETVLLQGAGGGVGTAFMQVARNLGIRVLATDREAQRAHLEAQGGVLVDFEREDVAARCRS